LRWRPEEVRRLMAQGEADAERAKQFWCGMF
jgi:hypothetical protein